RRGRFARLLLMRERCADVADEQRMPAPRIRGEFRVVLASEEPGMIRQLDHLAQVAGKRALGPGAYHEAGGLDARQVMVVHLVTMSMTLRHTRRAIDAVG